MLAGVAATVTTVAVVAVPGIASADGTGDFCANTGYCLSMNGTTDNLVYAKLPQNDKQQTTNPMLLEIWELDDAEHGFGRPGTDRSGRQVVLFPATSNGSPPTNIL